MELSSRKHPRLKEYDYSQNGCYFITLCTKNKKCLLGKITVEQNSPSQPSVYLAAAGRISKKYIENIETVYKCVKVENYVIMPNHIHLLLSIDDFAYAGKDVRPTVQTIVRSFKTMVTKQLGFSVWQASFYDVVVRNEAVFLEIYKYIDDNPFKWVEDELYVNACQ